MSTESKTEQCGNSVPSALESDELSSTVNNFANRIKRKLKEQESESDVRQRATEQRHALVLQAMNIIRKSLHESARVDLGTRFSLELDTTDTDGWPKLELNLIDALCPGRVEHGFFVSVNDRTERGLIQMTSRTGQLLGQIALENPANIEKLPLFLKKVVRNFLDTVAVYVLNPIRPEDVLEEQTKEIESETLDHIGAQLKNEDLFEETFVNRDNVVEESVQVSPLNALVIGAK